MSSSKEKGWLCTLSPCYNGAEIIMDIQEITEHAKSVHHLSIVEDVSDYVYNCNPRDLKKEDQNAANFGIYKGPPNYTSSSTQTDFPSDDEKDAGTYNHSTSRIKRPTIPRKAVALQKPSTTSTKANNAHSYNDGIADPDETKDSSEPPAKRRKKAQIANKKAISAAPGQSASLPALQGLSAFPGQNMSSSLGQSLYPFSSQAMSLPTTQGLSLPSTQTNSSQAPASNTAIFPFLMCDHCTSLGHAECHFDIFGRMCASCDSVGQSCLIGAQSVNKVHWRAYKTANPTINKHNYAQVAPTYQTDPPARRIRGKNKDKVAETPNE